MFNLSGSGADRMEKAKSSIFYSWQSDLDGKTTRSFIEDALRRAVKALRKDDTLDVEPVIDRDTQDVPGSPDIAKTILEKIERAQIFVGDVSIVNQGAKRLTPNPNVVYELAYARRALGGEHVIMVMNTAYGTPQDLPFDLRQHRVIGYSLPEEIDDESLSRTDIRKGLENSLKRHILTILKLDEPQPAGTVSLFEQACGAIKEDRRDQIALVQDYINDLAEKIPLILPVPDSSTIEMQERLIHALRDSIGVVIEFAQLVKVSMGVQADEVIRAIYRAFASILSMVNSNYRRRAITPAA